MSLNCHALVSVACLVLASYQKSPSENVANFCPGLGDVTLDELASFTLRKESSRRDVAIARVNAMKSEYGNGSSTLVIVYNATGETLELRSKHDHTYVNEHTM